MKKFDEQNSKERILKVASKLFAQKGFAGTSVREISKAAGVNVAMISYFWGGKKELFHGIINNTIEKQTRYAKSALDFAINPEDLSKEQQIELMYRTVDKAIEFFYSDLSSELLTILTHGQKEKEIFGNLPLFKYGKKLVAALFDLKENDKEVILTLVSIITLINAPRLMPNFSLQLMNQRTFHQEDVRIIRKNVRTYMEALLRTHKLI